MGTGAVLAFVFVNRSHDRATHTEVKIGTATYRSAVARTDADMVKGLSGTPSLPAHDAMLFVFPGDAIWPIWMKDMKYPLDIVWIDKDKVVQYIVKNAQPSSYPKTMYRPAHAVRYVLELNAGQVDAAKIKEGQTVHFVLPAGAMR